MRPLSEREIRTAFVNCSKGEASRLGLPRNLAEQPWPDLDYLGWRDPRAPERAYLVTELADGVKGIALRYPTPTTRRLRRSMCSICVTSPVGGVALMVAPKAGPAGRQGNTVGTYLCSDLSCSLYVRGKKDPGVGGRLHESLTLEEKIQRTVSNLTAFITTVGA